MVPKTELKELEQIIGLSFKDKDLLQKAVTHSSYANEEYGDPAMGNERLEFLGDAVLDVCVAEALYSRLSAKAEGDLSKMRASIVCERSLSEAVKTLGINRFLLLSRGEEKGGGRNRASIMADMLEAIIGAGYLDGGMEASKAIVARCLTDTIEECLKGGLPSDAKSCLQEMMGKAGEAAVSYEILSSEGPDHNKVFTAAVYVNGEERGRGRGCSKKKAEQSAAAAAVKSIKAER